ncbi:MAG: polysaccharide deacetylase family protein [Gemmatimonadaceae bacterium]|nr:polysaccharide deacetylase family protein [Gemmatimonadaceae bacterium]
MSARTVAEGGLMRLPGAGRVRRVARTVAGAARRRCARGLVLLYHRVAGPRFDPQLLDVAPATFAAHMDVLQSWGAVLAVHDFEVARRAGRLPPRAVCITFDDGYADNLHAAARLLEARRLPATVFVTSGMIDAPGEFWWDDLERVVAAPSLGATAPSFVQWRGGSGPEAFGAPWTIEQSVATARQQLYLDLSRDLRLLDPAERDARVAELRGWAGVPRKARESHRSLMADELRQLAAMAGITIGAHTVRHPVMARQSPNAQRKEWDDSIRAIATVTGRKVTVAAYPYGGAGDVSRACETVAREVGFDTVFANEAGAAWRWSRRWRVPRLLVRDWPADEFLRRLTTWWESA